MKHLFPLFLLLSVQQVFSQVFVFNTKTEGMEGDLLTSAEAGFYTISYNGIITEAADDNSLLTFTITYTDAETNALVTLPSTNIDNYNTSVSNMAGKSAINGNLIIYPQSGTAIRYIIQYASNPISAMKYTLRISLKKL